MPEEIEAFDLSRAMFSRAIETYGTYAGLTRLGAYPAY